jgi:nitrogen fixation NifU-like protein
MSELRELYQEVIVDHAKRPRNFRRMASANRTIEGYNPLCGDRITLYLEIEGDRVKDVSFEGSGCAISTASASMMTETMKSKTIAEAEAIAERFHDLVTSPADAPAHDEDLGKLAVFGGVREFPARVKCATLVWHSLRSALDGNTTVVSTE